MGSTSPVFGGPRWWRSGGSRCALRPRPPAPTRHDAASEEEPCRPHRPTDGSAAGRGAGPAAAAAAEHRGWDPGGGWGSQSCGGAGSPQPRPYRLYRLPCWRPGRQGSALEAGPGWVVPPVQRGRIPYWSGAWRSGWRMPSGAESLPSPASERRPWRTRRNEARLQAPLPSGCWQGGGAAAGRQRGRCGGPANCGGRVPRRQRSPRCVTAPAPQQWEEVAAAALSHCRRR